MGFFFISGKNEVKFIFFYNYVTGNEAKFSSFQTLPN